MPTSSILQALLCSAKCNGDSAAFARYAFAKKLRDDLSIRLIQTGEGTFWTDLGKSAVGPVSPVSPVSRVSRASRVRPNTCGR